MNCKYTKLLLSHYVEQELVTKRRKGLEHHLQACLTCRREMDKMLKTVRIIQNVEEVDPPRDYLQSVKASLTGRYRCCMESYINK